MKNNIDGRFKVKVGILLVLTLFGYFFGISTINSNIRDLKQQRSEIRNINNNITLLNLISSRIYILDDRITSSLIGEGDFIREYRQIVILRNGLTIFSSEENTKLDSLIDISLDNINMYSKDTTNTKALGKYYSKKIETNTNIRKMINVLVVKYIDDNNKNLNKVLDDYEKSYYKYIVIGSSMVVLFTFIGFLLIRDMIILVRSNYRVNSTIDDFIRFMRNKRS